MCGHSCHVAICLENKMYTSKEIYTASRAISQQTNTWVGNSFPPKLLSIVSLSLIMNPVKKGRCFLLDVICLSFYNYSCIKQLRTLNKNSLAKAGNLI